MKENSPFVSSRIKIKVSITVATFAHVTVLPVQPADAIKLNSFYSSPETQTQANDANEKIPVDLLGRVQARARVHLPREKSLFTMPH